METHIHTSPSKAPRIQRHTDQHGLKWGSTTGTGTAGLLGRLTSAATKKINPLLNGLTCHFKLPGTFLWATRVIHWAGGLVPGKRKDPWPQQRDRLSMSPPLMYDVTFHNLHNFITSEYYSDTFQCRCLPQAAPKTWTRISFSCQASGLWVIAAVTVAIELLAWYPRWLTVMLNRGHQVNNRHLLKLRSLI